MRRSKHLLALTIFVVLLLGGAESANAKKLPVPFETQATVTSNFVYWIRYSPKGCHDCFVLVRTGIADGRTSTVRRVRHGTIVRLTAQGNLVSYVIFHEGPTFRSSVVLETESGERREVAKAAYRMRKKSGDCGSEVESIGFAPDGELAWLRVQATQRRGARGGCAVYPHQATSTVTASRVDGSARTLEDERPVDTSEIFDAHDLTYLSPITAFNGSQLMRFFSPKSYQLTDLVTGTQRQSDFNGVNDPNPIADLGPSGDVAVVTWDKNDKVRSMLYPDFLHSSEVFDITLPGDYEDRLYFCGSQLIQLHPEDHSLLLVRRDHRGAELGRTRLPIRSLVPEPGFSCNSTMVLIRYVVRESALGDIQKDAAVTVPLN